MAMAKNKKGNSGASKTVKGGVIAKCTELALPIVKEFGLTLWDLRYEKEGSEWFLRVFIDKLDGAITIEDCVDVSRKLNKLLDEVDPISESYCLQVSSPGVERELRKPEHFQQFLGEPIAIKLFRPIEGTKVFEGILQAYEDGKVYISELSEYDKESDEVEVIGFDKKEIATVNALEFWDEETFNDDDLSDQED